MKNKKDKVNTAHASGPGGQQHPTEMVAVKDAPLQGEAGETPAVPGPKSSGEFKRVPRGLIRPDPNQPRKNFTAAALAEMAVSIYLQGIIQPLVVKAVPALTIKEPDMIEKNWQAVDHTGAVVFSGPEENVKNFAAGKTEEYFQLIAGERRWRSSEPRELEIDGRKIQWPGLAELPVMVREAGERDTFALQHMENQARENLTALEEAQSFGEELTRRQAADPSFTAEKLGLELGVKKGTAYSRMKLLRLKPAVRAALLEGKIETSHALAISTVPDVKRQKELLKRVEEYSHYRDGVMSSRALQELIDDEYVKQLKDAPFDKEALLLSHTWLLAGDRTVLVLECPKKPQFVHPITIGQPRIENGTMDNPGCFVTTADKFQLAGPLSKRDAKNFVNFLVENAKSPRIAVSQQSGWACVTCPHRSGVMEPESKTPNVCTLPSCFDAKVKAHWVKKSEELTAKGTPVLTEGAMRKLGKHIPEDRYEHNHASTFKELMGKHAPEPVLVATKEGIKKFYPGEQAIAAAAKNGNKIHSQSQTKSPEQKAKEEAAEKKRAELKKTREALADELLEDVAKALTKIGDRDAWEILDKQEVQHWGYEARPLKVLIKDPKTAKARVLGRRFAHRDLRVVNYNGEWDKETLAIYAKLGIDVLAIEKERAKDKVTEQALPLAKPAPQQKTLLDVKQKGRKNTKKQGKK